MSRPGLRKLFSALMVFMIVAIPCTVLVSTSQVQASCPSDVWVAQSPAGSDLNPGTQAAPFATIGKGVETICTNGTVHVMAGSYTESVLITKSINLEGAGRDLLTVNIGTEDYVFKIQADNVRVRGFTATTGFHYGNGIVLDGVRLCNIVNNNVNECYYGISLQGSSANVITNNNVYDNYYDGIYLWRSSGNTVTNNNARDNWGDGIVLWESNGNTISENNVYGNLGWSCPYVYSWNGQEYKLDAHMLGNAPRANAEKSDYDSLEYMVPSDGKHLMKLTEELDETSWVDELKLIAVDHVIGSKVVMDMQGNIHTLCSSYTPLSAVDEEGIECLNAVNAQDGNYWISNMENKDFSQAEDLRDGIVLTFEKPTGVTSAKVVASYRKTGLGAFIHVHWARILPQPPIPPKIRNLGSMLNSLQLQVKSGDTWGTRIPFMDTTGSTLGRNDIAFTGDISGITGNTLTIKVESITGLVDIDSVTVYYSDCDEPATSLEIAAALAIDGNGTDVTQLLGADDGNYLVLNKGDYADLNFYYTEPVDSGYQRSYFVKANGYYVFPNLTPLPQAEANNLMGQFKDDFIKAYQFYLNKYDPSSSGNCGINVTYSSNNLISGNEIYDNAYEGVYLYYAHNNRIIGNHIFENDCGIWMECSNNNQILCNDILNNIDWSGIMIDYYARIHSFGCSSTGNAIHYNNIVGNLYYGVLNNSIGAPVDAINNWWGSVSGPGGAGNGTGDPVSPRVNFTPWLVVRNSTISTLGGLVTFTTNEGAIVGLTMVPENTLSAVGRPPVSFPYGLFSFNIIGIAPGSTVIVTITLPTVIPAGTQYWKYQNGQWVDLTSLLGDNDGDNILTLTLTDGGLGDADGQANGTIVDPGGPCITSIPSQSSEGASSGDVSSTTVSSPNLNVAYMTASPGEVTANQPVTITANVVNKGGMVGSTRVALKINGQVEQTKLVTVGPGGNRPIKFTVNKAEPGTYSVIIGSQRTSFLVTEDTARGASIDGGVIAIMLLVLLAAAVVIVLAISFGRRPA